MKKERDDKERGLLHEAFRYALSLSHNRESAEDLVQECWLRLYSRYGTVLDKRILFRAIRNRFIDIYRKEKIEVVDADLDPVDDKDLEMEIEHRFETSRIHGAMGALHPEERELLFLQCVEGYTAQEISDLTNRPRGTVLSLVHRARKKVLHLLKKESECNVLPFSRRKTV